MLNLPERTRAYLYRIGIALMPLLIMYGVLSEHAAALWVGVLSAVLSVGGSGLAARNTSTSSTARVWTAGALDDGHGPDG